jgi:anti-sigma factor RsiW
VSVDDVACRELVERITDLFDGTLTVEEQQAVEDHLRGCPGCRAAVEQFRRTIDVLGALPAQDVRQLDPAVVDGLLDALRRRGE